MQSHVSGIAVDLLGAEKDLEGARRMPERETGEECARQGHQRLARDEGILRAVTSKPGELSLSCVPIHAALKCSVRQRREDRHRGDIAPMSAGR